MERRQSDRINLTLRCHVKIGENNHEISLGQTENISRTGLMMRLANTGPSFAPAIDLGQYLEAYVELPRSQAQPPRSLCCKSTVVWLRTDESGDLLLGLSVLQMTFRDLPLRFSQPEADLAQGNSVVM
jgi:hypothetical protein